MAIITRIEIRNFRSIHYLVVENGLDDLNVFVGNNDIGKSNILRALNLFFNDQTDIGKSIDFWEDFNKRIKRVSGKGQYIKIVLDIALKYETNKFVRWTRQWNNQGVRNVDEKKVFTNDNEPSDFIPGSRAPGWLDRMIFRYIPAVKSPLYFQHLFEELHDVLSSSYSEQFQENTKLLIKSIQDITSDITSELSETLSIANKISIPTDLKMFFGSLDFSLQENDRSFNLSSRGDGIKVRHIPVVLKFLAQKAKINKRGTLDIQTIWGFEEPENNLEMSHAFEVAKKFIEYSSEIQIFLTTHSPAFYSLRDNRNRTSCWFVDRNEQNYTIVINVKDSAVDIDERMGILAYITPFVNQKNEELKREKEEREALKILLDDLNPNKRCIVFTEDSADENIMLKALLKSNDFNLDETAILTYDGKNNLKNAIYACKWLIKEKYKNVLHVVFHRDRDIDGDRAIEYLRPTLPLNYSIYLTVGYDMDSCFLNVNHINSIYPELKLDLINEKLNESIEQTKSKSIDKLKDGLFQMHLENGTLTKAHSPSRLEKEALQLYNENNFRFSYGKTVLGNLKGKLQHSTLERKFDIVKPSAFLIDNELYEIAKKLWVQN